jgi:F-type H+-transporting ATPase subunit a
MPEISIKAEHLFNIGGFSVTNSVLLSFIVLVLLTFVAISLNRKIKLVPGKTQSLFEILFEEVLSLMDSILGTRELSIKYFPFVATIFIFVLFSNWFGLLPGVGSIILHEGSKSVPIFRSPAADLNFTIMLAMISVVAVNFFGILTLGVKRYSGKFFNFKNPIMTFVGLLELISEFVKVISFSFRLFGNVFAGEVLLIVIGFLVPYLIPLPFLFLEVFVGMIQAFIFSMLTVVFLAISINHEEAH